MKDLRLVCYGEQAYGSESERSEQRDFVTSDGRAWDNYKKDSTRKTSHLFIHFRIRQETQFIEGEKHGSLLFFF